MCVTVKDVPVHSVAEHLVAESLDRIGVHEPPPPSVVGRKRLGPNHFSSVRVRGRRGQLDGFAEPIPYPELPHRNISQTARLEIVERTVPISFV